MNTLSRFICFAGVGVTCCLQGRAQPVTIPSLSANGQVTVTAPVGSDITVEWTPNLDAGGHWSARWDGLTAIRCTNTTMKLDVPMFYRVSCFTNGLFWPMKPGASLINAVSNAFGETTLREVKLLGRCYVPEFTNYYTVMHVDDTHVTGGDSGGTILARTDDQGFWMISDPISHLESQEFVRGAVGTVITNANNERVAIEAIETVTVPAGTFTNCLKFHKTQLSTSDPHPDWYEWISPGFGMVKYVDEYGGPTNGHPVVYQLQSYSGL